MARRSTQRSKQQVNILKQAWEWADITEPKNITNENIQAAYRVAVPSCFQGSCRSVFQFTIYIIKLILMVARRAFNEFGITRL